MQRLLGPAMGRFRGPYVSVRSLRFDPALRVTRRADQRGGVEAEFFITLKDGGKVLATGRDNLMAGCHDVGHGAYPLSVGPHKDIRELAAALGCRADVVFYTEDGELI